MRFGLTLPAALLVLMAAMQTGAAQQATPTGPVPPQTNPDRNSIVIWLSEKLSQVPDAEFLNGGIAASDIPRLKACMVQAVVTDIPDAPARQVAAALAKNTQDQAIKDWVLDAFQAGTPRQNQTRAQVKKLCPEFESAIGS